MKTERLSDISVVFTKKGSQVEYRVLTNLSENTLEAAFVNWSFRTNKFTINSFCKYVTSKDCEAICKPYVKQ